MTNRAVMAHTSYMSTIHLATEETTMSDEVEFPQTCTRTEHVSATRNGRPAELMQCVAPAAGEIDGHPACAPHLAEAEDVEYGGVTWLQAVLTDEQATALSDPARIESVGLLHNGAVATVQVADPSDAEVDAALELLHAELDATPRLFHVPGSKMIHMGTAATQFVCGPVSQPKRYVTVDGTAAAVTCRHCKKGAAA